MRTLAVGVAAVEPRDARVWAITFDSHRPGRHGQVLLSQGSGHDAFALTLALKHGPSDGTPSPVTHTSRRPRRSGVAHPRRPGQRDPTRGWCRSRRPSALALSGGGAVHSIARARWACLLSMWPCALWP